VLCCAGCGKTELCKQFQRAGFWVLDEAFLDMPEYALHPQSLLMETSWVVSWFLRLLRHAAEIKLTHGKEPVCPDPVFQLSGRSLQIARVFLSHVDAVRSNHLIWRARSQIFIADRSPFSAVLYGANGHLLEPVIREHMREVLKAADILVFTVYLQVPASSVFFARVASPASRVATWRAHLWPRADSRPADTLQPLLLQVERETLWGRICDRLKREPTRVKYNEVGLKNPELAFFHPACHPSHGAASL
jgi:hypothetical protein